MTTFDQATKVWKGPDVPYEFASDSTIGAEVLKKLAETPERTLHISHDDGISMTCEQTRIASIRVAQNLTNLGFKAGDVFGFICRNGINLPATLYGSILIGAPVNPLDIGFKKDDMRQMFEQTNPKLVFCDAEVHEITKTALRELGNESMLITLNGKIDGVMNIEELMKPTGTEDTFE